MNLPQLLVSVRQACEVDAALVGGTQIIDVKEPRRGALGMADPQTLLEVVSAIENYEQSNNATVSLSVALGELADWKSQAEFPDLHERVNYFKLGLAEVRDDEGWQDLWHSVRKRWEEQLQRPMCWIAVVYADWQKANSPHPNEIVAAASADPTCVGVLVDTYAKDGSTLLDNLSHDELVKMSEVVRGESMLFALAGRVDAKLLVDLVEFQPDVIGIRTAACAGGQRSGDVDQTAVRSFQLELRNAFANKMASTVLAAK